MTDEEPKKLDRAEAPTTDAMLDIYDHLSDGSVKKGEFFASHGLNVRRVNRAIAAMVPAGDGRTEAATAGLILGLQLGAMRLPPVDSSPSESEPPCTCLLCVLERRMAAEGDGGGED